MQRLAFITAQKLAFDKERFVCIIEQSAKKFCFLLFLIWGVDEGSKCYKYTYHIFKNNIQPFFVFAFQAMQNFMWNCAVFLVAFASFTTYSLSVSETLSVGTAFVSLGR